MVRKTAICAMLLCVTLGAAAPQPDVAVNIDNFTFAPVEVEVAQGKTVVWTNRDDIPHTITASDMPRPFKSDALDTNDHYSYRFDKAGRFLYFCSLHAHMQGVIVVK